MLFLSETESTPKMTKAISRDPSRPVLTAAYLHLGKKVAKRRQGWLVGTDSYKLAALPVDFDEDENPTAGPVSAEILKALEKAKIGSRWDGDKVVVDAVTYERPKAKDLGQPPKWEMLMPEEGTISDFRVGLNAAFVKDIADALGSEQIVLEFISGADLPLVDAGDGERYKIPANVRIIRVRPLRGRGGSGHAVADGPVGLLMPIRVAS